MERWKLASFTISNRRESSWSMNWKWTSQVMTWNVHKGLKRFSSQDWKNRKIFIKNYGSPTNSQSVFFSLHAGPTCSLPDTYRRSPPPPDPRWAFSRKETVHFFACLLSAATSPLQLQPQVPRRRLSHSLPIQVRIANELKFAERNNPIDAKCMEILFSLLADR